MQTLLNTPSYLIQDRLSLFMKQIPYVFPLRKQHRQELQYAVKDLSRLLTTERGQRQSYWSAPRLLGAYMYYFLPWNLLRLSLLLPNLPLNIDDEHRILDLGSGPLTLPLGLWLSRPDLAEKKISIIASDLAPRPMELGRALLDLMQKGGFKKETAALSEIPKLPWDTRQLRAPFEIALRKAGGRVNLITAANVFNEIDVPRHESMEERMAGIFTSLDRALLPGGQILLIEPGTRLGGKIVSTQRKMALEMGYKILSPCPHVLQCPLIPAEDEDKSRFSDMDDNNSYRISGSRGGGLKGRVFKENAAPKYRAGAGSWCHFSHTAEGAPDELHSLSYAAGLEKEKLHLSFILLQKPELNEKIEVAKQAAAKATILDARVLSDPIKLPDSSLPARYVCTSEGLGLLKNAKAFESGQMVKVRVNPAGSRDAKTGALDMNIS